MKRRRVTMMRYLLFGGMILLGLLATVWAEGEQAGARDCWVYVGNYAKGEKKGVYLFRMEGETGALTAKGMAGEAEDPNFLAVHPSGRFLYAVTTTKVRGYAGAVEAFAIDAATGKLTLLNRQASGAAEPVHVAVDAAGKWLAVANYSGASLSIFPIGEDGRVGDLKAVVKHYGSERHERAPLPHCVAFDAQGRRVLVADLAMDKVICYDITGDAPREAGAAEFPKGTGPRHIAFSPDGKRVYVVCELNNTLHVLAYGAEGSLKEIETMTPWPDAKRDKDYAAEVAAVGRYVYASERGMDSIAVLNGAGEKVTVVQNVSCGGKWPRHFGIDPSGRFLLVANQKSDSVTVFRRDEEKGTLEALPAKADVPAPVCVVFVPVR